MLHAAWRQMLAAEAVTCQSVRRSTSDATVRNVGRHSDATTTQNAIQDATDAMDAILPADFLSRFPSRELPGSFKERR
jgi:hypothetical protein